MPKMIGAATTRRAKNKGFNGSDRSKLSAGNLAGFSRNRHRLTATLCAALALLTLFGLSCVGPQTREAPVEPGELPRYELRVIPVDEPRGDDDGYEALLRFELIADGPFPYRHLVQEIRQDTRVVGVDGAESASALALVEAFRLSHARQEAGRWVYRLNPFQRDRHFETGFSDMEENVREVIVTREVRAYPAVVAGADFTALGFAHLPANRNGSLVTGIPANFNRRYQAFHGTRGRVLVDDREAGSRAYRMEYRWTRDAAGKVNPDFAFVELP